MARVTERRFTQEYAFKGVTRDLISMPVRSYQVYNERLSHQQCQLHGCAWQNSAPSLNMGKVRSGESIILNVTIL